MTQGHNNPPELTPFEQSREEITALYQQAKDLLDGEPPQTQVQADEVQTLMRELQGAAKGADKRRKLENKPFDEGKAAVQAKYNALTSDNKNKPGMAQRAIETCKAALVPFMEAQETIRIALEVEARKIAMEKQRIADEQMQEARLSADLAKREQAEVLLKEAMAAQKAAVIAKPKASGMGRAASLRTTYEPEITDRSAAVKWFWLRHPSVFDELILTLAKQESGRGNRKIDGVKFNEKRTVV